MLEYDSEKQLTYCMASEIVIASLIAMCTVLGIDAIVSPLFMLSFIIPFVYLLHSMRKFPGVLLLLTALCIFNVFFNGMLDDGKLNFDYFKKLIMFLSFMYLSYYCAKIEECRKTIIEMIKILPIVAGIVFVISYFWLGKTDVWGGGIILGFSNPNTAGMWLFHLILYGILFLFDSKKRKIRFLYIPIVIALIYMLEMTKTRSCYVALVFFALLVVLRIFNIKPNKIICLIILLLPLIYAFIYLKIAYTTWFQSRFDFMISEGKSLTSRVRIWNEAFDSIKEHFIFGNYSGISNGTGQSQLHNTHIDVLCSYGIIPFLLFIKILYNSITVTIEKANSFYKYAAFSAFCAVLIMGTFEAAVVSGAMGLNLLSVGFLVLAVSDEAEMKE